jgi:7,8-dihydropterin-6-yl-methyl-4-(beta-D-ribofuranosyl)aminobenzene 5'-phosphate synthase
MEGLTVKDTSSRRCRIGLLWLILIAREPASAGAGEPGEAARPASRVQTLTVTVLSTMLADTRGLGEWGFAALVEADGHRLLFDTGARPDTVLANARELGIDLAGVRDVVLSHHHGDHTGGLVALRRELGKTDPRAVSRAYVGPGIFLSRPADDGRETNATVALKGPYEAAGGRFVEVDRPTEVFPGTWLTGPVPRRHPERNWSGQMQVRTAQGLVEDTLPEDLSLVLDTDKGLVVVTGCGHAGVVNIVEYARAAVRPAPVHALIGGRHLFSADDKALGWTGDRLREAGVSHLLGAHCTGVEAVYELRGLLRLERKSCVVGAVGSRFDLKTGIEPGTIAR